MRSIFKCGSVGLRAMTKKSHSRAIPQQLWVWVSSITRTSPISAVGSEAGQPLGWSGRRAAVVAIAREPSSKLGGEGHREEDAEEGPGRPLGQGGSRVDGERKDAGPRSSRRGLLGRSRPHLRRPHRLHHRHQHHRPPSRIESWGLHGGSSLCMHAWAGDGRRRVIASRSAGDNMSGARAQYVGWGCLEWHTPRVSCGCTMPSCSSIPVSCVWTSNPHPV